MRKGMRIICFLIIVLGLFASWNKIIIPNTSIFDGRNENSYMNFKGFKNLPPKSLDYVVLGSSNVFMNINPIKVWEEYGISGYAYASPAQSFYTSLFYLKDLIKTQSPSVVFLDCWGITYEHTIEAYTHLGLDYFPLSKEKISAIHELPYNKEEYYFPFTLYHSRWNSLYKSDFSGLQYSQDEDFLGYVPTYMIQECEMPLLSVDKLEGMEAEISGNVEEVLDEIKKTCEEESIRLILIKTPNAGWTVDMSDVCQEYAEKHGLRYIDFNGYKSPVQIDLETDFCDGGHHLNIYGANKISDYLGLYLCQNYNVLNKKNDLNYSYYNKFSDSLQHYEKVCRIKMISDFKTYADFADDECFYLFLAGNNNENSAFITEYLKERYHCRIDGNEYVSMVCGDDILGENCGETASMEKKLLNNNIYLEANQCADKKNIKIQLNYQNYAKEGSFAVTVYDKKYNKIIDNFVLQNDDVLTIVR